MVKAVWNGWVLAISDDTVVVEGSHYFPADSVLKALLRPSRHTTECSRKGRATYFTILADGREHADAAWLYPDPAAEAVGIRGRIAFRDSVTVS